MHRPFVTGIAAFSLAFSGLFVFAAAGLSQSAIAGTAAKPVTLESAVQPVLPMVGGGTSLWLEQRVGADGGAAGGYFGFSVAIDGDTALVGADLEPVDGDFRRGAVYVFTRVNGIWQQTAKLIADDGAPEDQFGFSVAVKGDTALIGAPYASGFNGAVYVYKRSDSVWSETAKLVADDAEYGNAFGISVALDGTTALVGAEYGDPGDKGAAYVFTQENGAWTQTAKLSADDGMSLDDFGRSVALDGDTALVGAQYATINGNYGQGAAYVYTRTNGTWNQEAKLTAPDGIYGDNFGVSVALDGSTALVGAAVATVGDNYGQGAAYVFTRTSGLWSEITKLVADDGGAGDRLGASVALDAGRALVGAQYASKLKQGAAYLFTRSNGDWDQTFKFFDASGVANDFFGQAVAFDGGTVLVGAYGINDTLGRAYFFGQSDLGLAVSAPARVNPGDNFIGEMIATNDAEADSPGVVVKTPVPPAASYVSASASQGSCDAESGVIICAFGAISGNVGTATADITFKATGGEGATIESKAEVESLPPLGAGAATKINYLPVASDGTLNADENAAASGTLVASDGDEDPLVFSLVSTPAHGRAAIDDAATGAYTYTPDEGFSGVDSFTFRASDGMADSNIATVIVTVSNRPPVASGGTLETEENSAASDVLQASDEDGDTLTFSLVSLPAHGQVTLDNAATGAYTYTPDANYWGSDSFSFQASDGQANSNVAVVSITVAHVAPPPPPPESLNGGGGGGVGLLMLGLLAGLAFMAVTRHRGVRRGRRAGDNQDPLDRGDMAMRTDMKRLIGIGALALALAMIAAPPAQASAPSTGARAGLAAPLGKADAGPRLIAMAPQTALPLLARAQRVGWHDPASIIRLTVGLRLRNVNELRQFLQQVQNPRSSVYRKFLTPEQFTERYGPTKSQVAAVVQFLERNGIKVMDVSSNRLLIHTEAATAAYVHAFGIRINDYTLDGRKFFSTKDRPKLPRSVEPYVQGIIGLDNAVQMRPHHHARPLVVRGEHRLTPATPTPPPASSAYYSPKQIAKAYDWPVITSGDSGSGVTIAIITASSSNLSASDYEGFWSAFGLPDHVVKVIPVDGDVGNTDGTIETLLDMEWAGAMGPGAALHVYVAADPSFASFIDAFNQFVTDNDAQVMTTSWGAPEIYYPTGTVESIFMQAVAQGISMFAAAGDYGSSDCGPDNCPPGDNNADYPSSSIYVTAANGTELHTDVNGNYISETAWSDSGGAISQVLEQPEWQVGPGVPSNGWRNNSDLSLNAGPARPYLVVYQGQWYNVWGTSAVAPQFAGLFAIGIWQNGGAELGQSNELIYGDVNAGNYASDFRDVTTGGNGAYQAEKDWDHPTGWGSPRAASLLSHLGAQGPTGTLSGTVTDAASGLPIAGALVTVTPGNFHRLTDDNGAFLLNLAAGSYSVTITSFGYQPATAQMDVDDGATTNGDAALESAPPATLSGKVADGSGHGYGLYARIVITTPGFGRVAEVWTNPANGKYSVELPSGFTYTLNAVSALNGYNPAFATLFVTSDSTKNLALTVPYDCTAPGYDFAAGGFAEDFNGSWPPSGWTVTNDVTGAATVWLSNVDWGDDNWTGGTGKAADVNNGSAGGGPYDTSLVSPPIAVSSLPATAVLQYRANYQAYFYPNTLDLDISSDDGATWINLLDWNSVAENCGSYASLPGCQTRVNLGPYLPDSGDIRLRWRYYDLTPYAYDPYAQVDDVTIGSCQPVPGSLISGQVSDANRGNGVVGASVSDDMGDSVTTIANPSDPNLPAGSYLLFAPAGERALTAAYGGYQDAAVHLAVADDKIVGQDFALAAGVLGGDPDHFTVHVMVNNQSVVPWILGNSGSAAAHFDILTINAALPATAASGHASFAPAPIYDAGADLAAASLCQARQSCASKRSATEKGAPTPSSASPGAAGDVVASFPAGRGVYGLGVNRNAADLWLGSVAGLGGDDKDHRFLFDGTDTGEAIDVAIPQVEYMADMAYDDNTGMLWQLSVDRPFGNASHIYELNPTTRAPTGRTIPVPSPQSERGLAYDPLSQTWYAGDFNSQTIYHFDAAGILLDSMNVGLPIQGLTYNSQTGHLFVLTTSGSHAIYVLDARNHYQQLGFFDVDGFYPDFSGAGLGHDCDGHLWFTDYGFYTVWEVESGEAGWCSFRDVPWLTVSPKAGTVAAGASATVNLTFDGTGQKEFTTSKAQLTLRGKTPYSPQSVPVTVAWDPQPVNLVLTGHASADVVLKGTNLAYTLTVANQAADNHGAATRVALTYPLPDGVSYVTSGGDAVCTKAEGSIACDFGTISLGAEKTVTLVIGTTQVGKVVNNMKVLAREPDSDTGSNTLELTSQVVGKTSLGLNAPSDIAIEGGSRGVVTVTLKNAGPDVATDVRLSANRTGPISLVSGTISQGSCEVANHGLNCTVGSIGPGGEVTATLTLFGLNPGAGSLDLLATTAGVNSGTANSTRTEVAVKESGQGEGAGSGGGGNFSWYALAALLGVLLLGAVFRRRTGSA